MTIRAKNIIDAADLIIYTGSLLGDDGFKDVKPTAKLVDSAGLHLEQIVELMKSAALQSQIVARVHDGDPAIFGALSEQAAPLEAAGVPFEVVPGVTFLIPSLHPARQMPPAGVSPVAPTGPRRPDPRATGDAATRRAPDRVCR